MTYAIGQRVRHSQYGEGVVVAEPQNGFLRVFFSCGERQIPLESLQPVQDPREVVIAQATFGKARQQKAYLSYLAYALPLMEGAAALTSAKVSLLPHQVVLTHRVASTSPRRFLIADEVGLGKTIEVALIIRELFSRGELERVLLVVPAGLVNNWHEEMNEVFHLNFEIFGREGDISDRRSNAFTKHHRLIASIDTLKRKSRLKKLEEAPPWDLVVFDEAHHLSAYKSGGKLKKTQNYRLAELLGRRTRDLLLLSATPHQGDHYRFWMLIRLLDPTLFASPEEMVEQRHRLNAIMFRRTKADVCRSDGSPLFARREVHTEAFCMRPEESAFYEALKEYLLEGFDLAKRQGKQGRAIGFIMAVFQKIAASSFAAVYKTLQKRLLTLTILEGIEMDKQREIEKRDALFREAKEMIREQLNLGGSPLETGQVDYVFADLKRKILKKMKEEEVYEEAETGHLEDMVAQAVNFALPRERLRIKALLKTFPKALETKAEKLLEALGKLWQQNPQEKIVIFTTYLGTVEMLKQEIECTFPDKGVAILKGGDHSAKLAAERRFRKPEGPKVLICTAARKEGINLQHARILFNFDLPWNPMDLEQRIGRIHRYGQRHTAQIYNLVLADTIEGRIFLLLEEKLRRIAETLGKVDEKGNIAEDFATQILGQLSEKLNYTEIYSRALADPELRRTKLELEEAIRNSVEAQKVVHELFQDLDRFHLEDYQEYAENTKAVEALLLFLELALAQEKKKLLRVQEKIYHVVDAKGNLLWAFTTDRELSLQQEGIELLGLDHPKVEEYLKKFRHLPPEQIGVQVKSQDSHQGILSIWHIEIEGERKKRNYILPLAFSLDGKRIPSWERKIDEIFHWPPAKDHRPISPSILQEVVEPMLQRELEHKSILTPQQAYSAHLIGWLVAH